MLIAVEVIQDASSAQDIDEIEADVHSLGEREIPNENAYSNTHLINVTQHA